jgi:signal transduction histidine kinase
VVVVVGLVCVLTWLNDGDTPLAAAIALVLTVGTAAATLGPAASGPLLGALLGAMAVVIALGERPIDVGFAAFLYGGAWLIGLELRRRRTQAEEALDLAEQTVHAARAQEAAAIEGERLRIARELHDIVAHSLSVVTLQTQSVRRRLAANVSTDGGHTPSDLEALQGAEDAARSAMAELRRLFSLLRAHEAPTYAPQPGVREIAGLAHSLDEAGISTTIALDPGFDLPDGIDLAAYRIVQEATTNILKHARARHATIAVHRDVEGLRIRVSDDGIGPTATVDGHGLIGIEERVNLYGGRLHIGPGPGGGYTVDALLPLNPSRVEP